jgi:hypothetical protein
LRRAATPPFVHPVPSSPPDLNEQIRLEIHGSPGLFKGPPPVIEKGRRRCDAQWHGIRGRRTSGRTSRGRTGSRSRSPSASSAARSPRVVRIVGWMPALSSRMAHISGPTPTCPSELKVMTTWTSSCCAPSRVSAAPGGVRGLDDPALRGSGFGGARFCDVPLGHGPLPLPLLVVAVHGVAGLPWLEHGALLDRIGRAVGALVVDGLVARLPQQAGRHRGSRAPSRGRIGEPDATLRIDDPDRLGDAVQDRTQQFARPGHRRRYARTASTRLWSSGALRNPSLLKIDVTWRSTAPTVTNCASAISG